MSKQKVLIIVDMQNDFVTGALGSDNAKAIIPDIKTEIEKYKNDPNGVVIFTRDTHGPDYLNTPEGKKLPVEHCIENTDGWQIVPELRSYSEKDCFVFNKPTFGYTAWEMLDELLENADIKLCGVCTDICVVSNALILKATWPYANISVDPKLCAGTSVENHNAAIRTMQSCQIDILE